MVPPWIILPTQPAYGRWWGFTIAAAIVSGVFVPYAVGFCADPGDWWAPLKPSSFGRTALWSLPIADACSTFAVQAQHLQPLCCKYLHACTAEPCQAHCMCADLITPNSASAMHHPCVTSMYQSPHSRGAVQAALQSSSHGGQFAAADIPGRHAHCLSLGLS